MGRGYLQVGDLVVRVDGEEVLGGPNSRTQAVNLILSAGRPLTVAFVGAAEAAAHARALAAAAGGPPLGEDPKYAKYFKMLKMHLPKPAVQLKMAAEGADPAVLDLDPSGPAPAPDPPAAAAAAAAPGSQAPYYESILPAVLARAPALTTERLAALADMWPTDVEVRPSGAFFFFALVLPRRVFLFFEAASPAIRWSPTSHAGAGAVAGAGAGAVAVAAQIKRLAGYRGSPDRLGSDGERWMLLCARCGVARARHKVGARHS